MVPEAEAWIDLQEVERSVFSALEVELGDAT
jgi:hypothetical protein